MTTELPLPTPPAQPPNRVTVVDIDMPFFSMIGFMLKWAIAAIPAMVILIMIGAFVSVVFAGIISGLTSTASLFDSSAEPTIAQATPLVVTVRPTADGWQVASNGTSDWRNCSLSIDGHSVKIPALASNAVIELPSSAFSNGGVPKGLAVTDSSVSMLCLAPESRQGRIYLAPMR
jgi:hypothetical protein